MLKHQRYVALYLGHCGCEISPFFSHDFSDLVHETSVHLKLDRIFVIRTVEASELAAAVSSNRLLEFAMATNREWVFKSRQFAGEDGIVAMVVS